MIPKRLKKVLSRPVFLAVWLILLLLFFWQSNASQANAILILTQLPKGAGQGKLRVSASAGMESAISWSELTVLSPRNSSDSPMKSTLYLPEGRYRLSIQWSPQSGDGRLEIIRELVIPLEGDASYYDLALEGVPMRSSP